MGGHEASEGGRGGRGWQVAGSEGGDLFHHLSIGPAAVAPRHMHMAVCQHSFIQKQARR